MDTKLLRKPWLNHALCSLLSLHQQPKVALPVVQLIEVDSKKVSSRSLSLSLSRALPLPLT